MGRFISADTIIPDPANPQSFNRYSYCLNNPLKYVDPSGQIVSVAGIGDVNNMSMVNWFWVMQMTEEAQSQVFGLLGAWYTLSEVASGLTQELIDAEEIIPIRFKNMKNEGEAPRYAVVDEETGEIIKVGPLGIDINSSKIGHHKDIVAIMAHESIHTLAALNGFFHNSIYEEACAWSYHQAVDKALGRWWFHDISNPFNDMRLSSSDAWVDQYVRDSNWTKTPSYRELHDKRYYYPNLNEGGYKMMKALYVDHYPGK